MAEVCSGAALDRERRLWEAYQSRSRERLEALIDPGALDVGPAGVLDRDGVLAAVSRMEIANFAISEMRVLKLGDVEIVTYRGTVEGSHDGKPFASSEVYTTSVWRRAAGRWRLAHRHETPARRG